MAHEIERLEDVLSLFTKPAQKSSPIVTIETDSLSILEKTTKAYFRQKNTSLDTHYVTLNNRPYEPFLSFLRATLSDLPEDVRDTYFDAIEISIFAKEILSLLIFEPTKNYTPFYEFYFDLDEFLFFQKEILMGIKHLLFLLGKNHPYLLVIRCSETASFTFFDFFSILLEDNHSLPFFILLLMDANLLNTFSEEQSYEWNLFFHNHQKSLFKFEFYFSDSVLENTSISPISPSTESMFSLLLCYQKHWAWRDVKYVANELLKKEHTLPLSHRKKTLYCLALALVFESSANEAIFTLEKLLTLLQENNDIHDIYLIQRTLAYIYLSRDAGRETALRIARQNFQIIQEENAGQAKLLAIVLLFVCGDMASHDFPNFFRSLLPQIKRIHPLIYIFVTSNYSFSILLPSIFSPEESITFLKKTLHLANKNGHFYRQSFYCHYIGIFYSRLHDYAKTIQFYKKSIRIRQKMGNLRRLSHAYNGFGYVYFAAENFEKAFHYYYKSLQTNIALKDYRELCMSLMNFIQLEMVRHNYQTAEELLSFLLDLKNQLGIETLPIHSNMKIKTMHAYLLEKLGKFVPYYHQTKQTISSLQEKENCSSREEYAYVQWYLALYYQRYIDPTKTIHAYEEAINAISIEEFNYNEMELRYDFLAWMKKHNHPLYEAKRLEFIQKMQSMNLYHYENYLVERVSGYTRHTYNIPKEHILETAKLYSQITQFQRSLETLEFMNHLQKTLLRQKNKETLITESMLLIKRYILVDFLVCYVGSYQEHYKNWRLIYSSHEAKTFPQDTLLNIQQCFTNRKDRLVVDLAANYMKLFFPNCYSVMYFPLFIEEQEAGCIFLANTKKENSFSEDVFHVMQMATRQINTMLENLFYAEILRHTAQTDMLTNCANRLAIRKRLEEEEERAKRSDDYNFSVVFTDMDNFKYYNDTFGHNIGDSILQEIAAFLAESIRRVDLLGRLGGDEFVLILPETDHATASHLVQRLYTEMENAHFFPTIIHKYVHDVAIPKDKYISISMGIADYRQAGSLQHLLEFADVALYEAKGQGKNKAVFYTNSSQKR